MFGEKEKERREEPKPKSVPIIKEDETPKHLRGEAMDEYMRTGEIPKGYMKIATPPQKKENSWTRFATFIDANRDLVALAIYTLCVLVLGYLIRCLQENLTSDQIRLGLEAFVEIIIAIFGTSIALYFKMLCNKGAIASTLSNKYEAFQKKLETRKKKIASGEIDEFGRSLKSK